jgi:hypothetical protein
VNVALNQLSSVLTFALGLGDGGSGGEQSQIHAQVLAVWAPIAAALTAAAVLATAAPDTH